MLPSWLSRLSPLPPVEETSVDQQRGCQILNRHPKRFEDRGFFPIDFHLASQRFAELAVDCCLRQNNVAWVLLRSLSRIDNYQVVHCVVVEFAPVRATRADRIHVSAALQPITFQDGRRRTGDGHNYVRATNRFFCRHSFAPDSRGKGVSVCRGAAPNPDLIKMPNDTQCLEMTLRLNAASQDGERVRVCWSEEIGRHC